MGLSDLLGKVLPLLAMLKPMIQYISTAVNQLTPDQLTPEAKAELQMYIGTVYSAAKNFGPMLVAKTTNDLDDAILVEAIEICEQAATKYGLELNPVNLA